MSEHTPGPWWAGGDDDAHMVYSGDVDTVDAVADCGRDDGDAEAEAANARLISAAPDLLAACELALESYTRWVTLGPLDVAACRQVSAAVRKAKEG